MLAHGHDAPVVRYQVAEAFAWKALQHLSATGVAGMLLPAMSFVTEAAAFRDAFFTQNTVLAVANFTNLRRVLFVARAETAAMAVFYSGGNPEAKAENFYAYSPLVVNQEVTRPPGPGIRNEPWTITVDRSEVRSIRPQDVPRYGVRAWTTAMWGTSRDLRLLSTAESRFQSLGKFAKSSGLRMSQGLEVRSRDSTEKVEHVAELVGKTELDMGALKLAGRIHLFPLAALRSKIPPERAFVRATRVSRPLEVCRPPHVIVNASRTFAVYSDEFIVVPARQIGISGEPAKENLLRALALYLSSDFVEYHRFLDSSQVAVRGVSTLASLRRLPCPVSALSPAELRLWADLHRALVGASESEEMPLLASRAQSDVKVLTNKLNALVADALRLTEAERWLVDDLVHVRMGLADGQVSPVATEAPTADELLEYAGALRLELDSFIESDKLAHRVEVFSAVGAAAVRIELVSSKRAIPARLVSPATDEASALKEARERIESTRTQWRYFDRNLIVYEPNSTIIMKPEQRVWWTKSQALADADELIADALGSEGGI